MTKEEAGFIIKETINDCGLTMILKAHGALVAGGAIVSLMEGREVKDIDVFFHSKETVQGAIARVKHLDGYESIYNNNTACMFTVYGAGPFNFVTKRFFHSLYELFDDFDFTLTMVGFDCRDGIIQAHIGFEDAFREKKIIFNHLNKYPLTSLKRVLKYQKRGYDISGDEIQLMGMAIADIDIKSGIEFAHHVGGMYSPSNTDEDKTFKTLGKVMDDYRERNPYNKGNLTK